MCRQVKFYGYCWVMFLLCTFSRAHAQGCPENIGFELGNFRNWETSLGRVDSANGTVLSPGFETSRHTIFKNNGEARKDTFGNFSVYCPNGSGVSIKLGNNASGAQAEGASYTFTIPSDRKTFSLIYYYAVVMQNPNHAQSEQPKFTAKVFNVSKGEYISCSSFEYVAQAGLPGFESSRLDPTILYKNWTPVTIKLSNYAGMTIRLEFVTNDCTRGGHFGYAYVDVDESCLSPIRGNIVCQDDSVLNLTAPYGFQAYRWFTGDFSRVISNSNTYTDPVIPPDNTEYAVELVPYPNQGCPDTVFTKIHYSTDSIVINPPDGIVSSCFADGVELLSLVENRGNSPGLAYTFYSDPTLTVHVFTEEALRKSGTYYIKGLNGDGCFAAKPVVIQINPTPTYQMLADIKPIYRPEVLDLTGVLNANGNTVTYWADLEATVPVANPWQVTKDGTYYLKITTAEGCSVMTSVTASFINPPPNIPNVFSPNGDGINDTWMIANLNYYPELVLDIYTRSGQPVYHSIGYSKPWDGKHNGTDLPIGTYYYVLKLTRSHQPIAASITIIR